jgi:outer membrane protein OmpA-like peptidoglycan-associated protein
MKSQRNAVCSLTLVVLLVSAVGLATEVTLYQVTFPERKTVDIEFAATERAPEVILKTDVKIKEGQAAIDIRFRDMKPAVLFGGDVTSYVLWAIAREGKVENLGELWVRRGEDSVEYSTGMKSFAMMITAEAYPLVSTPSELVLFTSMATEPKEAKSDTFVYSDFAPAPPTEYKSIRHVMYNPEARLDVVQAEKAYELAKREGAEEYTPTILRDATVTLGQARNFASKSPSDKQAVDYSRRTVALCSEAIQIIKRRKEAEELARQIAERKAEMASLEARARSAEETARQAQTKLDEAKVALQAAQLEKSSAESAILAAQQELTRLGVEKTALLQEQTRLQEEQARLQAEQARLLAEQEQLRQSVAEMAERAERLKQEREQLASRLESALSFVADTQASARGMIVNLPDILFDTDQASLKQEARVVIAKLAGILLVMPELNLRIEGHTDSTGSDEHNQGLSERRASSVRDFLAAQGIDMNRMVAVGYGEYRPIADNDTASGRARNRRVEIVIAEGVVKERTD